MLLEDKHIPVQLYYYYSNESILISNGSIILYIQFDMMNNMNISTRNARQIAFKSRSLIDILDRSSVFVINPSMTVLNGWI
jgi:hypothetical protein